MTSGLWARAALLAALAWAGTHAARRAVGEYEAIRSLPPAPARLRLVGAPLRAATGVDPWGRAVLGRPPVYATKFVLFVLRNESLSQDLAYWDEVQLALRSRPGIVLVGYCDGWSCGRALAGGRPPAFRVIEYGEITAMDVVWRADQQGVFLLLSRGAVVESTARWRRGSSAAEVAALLSKDAG